MVSQEGKSSVSSRRNPTLGHIRGSSGSPDPPDPADPADPVDPVPEPGLGPSLTTRAGGQDDVSLNKLPQNIQATVGG